MSRASSACSHKSTWRLNVGIGDGMVHHHCALFGGRTVLSNCIELVANGVLLVHRVVYWHELLLLRALDWALQEAAHLLIQNRSSRSMDLQVFNHIHGVLFLTLLRVLVNILSSLTGNVGDAAYVSKHNTWASKVFAVH